MADNRTFYLDIQKFKLKVQEFGDEFAREFPQDLHENIVIDSPVITGNFRNSWTGAIGAPDNSPPAGTSGDPLGSIALKLANAKSGDTIFINNNVVYGPRLEFGFVGTDSMGRNYNQSGRGFVRAVVARAEQIAEDTVRKIKAKRGR